MGMKRRTFMGLAIGTLGALLTPFLPIFDRLSNEINLGVAEYTAEHAYAAQRAYLRFGRGRHPAGLNLGDCMSYATAKLAHEPLLAIGSDFPQTDLEFGDGIVGYWPTTV